MGPSIGAGFEASRGATDPRRDWHSFHRGDGGGTNPPEGSVPRGVARDARRHASAEADVMDALLLPRVKPLSPDDRSAGDAQPIPRLAQTGGQ